ncbi:MAG: hypothetical protein JOZ44_00005, partial [Acidobacteria bacterium]|nr:hypothetical protein [Acidobacteriota bacterium]
MAGGICTSALQTPLQPAEDSAELQTEADEYTRYELLAPETASFRIYYEVTATTAGAKRFYNPIRKGSTASDESVTDAMTGATLHSEVVSGTEAAKDLLMSRADAATDYIRIDLARPVPKDGQGRLIILKTYKDTKSYYSEGDTIVFNRPLGIRRNKVVLPAGYQLISCNIPSQILSEADGRISVSFMNAAAGEAALVLKAKLGAPTGSAAVPKAATSAKSWEAPFVGESERTRLSERAHQDRDIVYFLNQPDTHSFSLYHDYTESRPGINKYLNVVRTGSTVSNPSAYILDTGEVLQSRIMTGEELAAAKIDTEGEPVTPTTQVVVVPFTVV